MHRSNHMEALVAALCRVLAAPVANPLEPETVVVQSRGMQRWVTLEVARRLGAAANLRFPFPRAIVDQILDSVLGDPPDRTRCFSRECLTWTVASLLPTFLGTEPFGPVARYLDPPDDMARRLQLSHRVAHGFDQVVVYRPELALKWEISPGKDWQARLWQAVVERHGRFHLAARAERFAESWPSADTVGLPSRICVFGVSLLPPLFVRMLAALSQRLQIHLFLLSPSREYWASLPSARALARERVTSGASQSNDDLAGLLAGEGHPLLSAWGQSARDMQYLLESSVDYIEPESDLYVDPGTGCLLAALQSDILGLRAPGRGGIARHVVAPADQSVGVHCCHSVARQLEVVQDQILDALDHDPTLQPHDVLVMVPDITAYAPMIDAVFGGQGDEDARIPYRIADRALHAESEVVESFLVLLDVIQGRLKASQVLGLLEHGPILRRFGLSTEDGAPLRGLVEGANIRWGLDAEDREQQGVPALSQNTWRFGIERLLLGYAMPGSRHDLFAGVLPYDDVEGQEALRLGQFVDLCERLFSWRRRLRAPKALSDWVTALSGMLDEMLQPAVEELGQVQAILDALSSLAEDGLLAGFDEPIELGAIEGMLQKALRAERQSHQFLTGHATFCEMLPMRSIPFRVICLVGLNDGEFPRVDRPSCLDPVTREHRTGDRSVRDEDRGLCLEALLSARDRLILTYAGHDPQDNTPRPPSVVVSELFAALDEGFRPAAEVEDDPRDRPRDACVSARVTVHHPLHAFSPSYFETETRSRLFSYSATSASLARTLVAAQNRLLPFLGRPLCPPSEPLSVVTLTTLERFLLGPARFLVEERLGVLLPRDEAILVDREPIELRPLDRYEIGSELLVRARSGEPKDASLRALRAAGVLPFGCAGDASFDRLADHAAKLALFARRWCAGDSPSTLAVDLVLGGVRLTGVLEDVWPTAVVRARYARIAAKPLLSLYLHHLALCAATGFGPQRCSVLVGRSPPSERRSVVAAALLHSIAPEYARERLAELMDLYRLGQVAPLRLFPASSLAYCQSERRHSGPDGERRALDAARQLFCGAKGSPVPAERDDPYVRLAFGDEDPLGISIRTVPDADGPQAPAFGELSRRVFGPLLDHYEVVLP